MGSSEALNLAKQSDPGLTGRCDAGMDGTVLKNNFLIFETRGVAPS